MVSLAEELKALDPHELAGEVDEDLAQAIERTVPLVDEFGRVALAIAEMDAREATLALFKGFEHVIKHYDLQLPVRGVVRPTDYDLFKFAGHEMCTVLFACLLRVGRWQLIDAVTKQPLFWKHPSGGPVHVQIDELSAHVALLDDIRTRRLEANRRRMISFHAEILRERHERTPPVGAVNWDEFRAADLLLALRTFDPASRHGYWFPRTSIYLMSPAPRFLHDAKTLSGAQNLAVAFGLTDLGMLKTRVAAGLQQIGAAVSQMGAFVHFERFDVDAIPT
jgi:hypothetical protein